MSLQRWDIDSQHASLEASVWHMRIARVRGHFKSWSGSVWWDPQNPSAFQADVQINLSSLDTGSAARDAHLKSEAFLDVAHHPYALYTSRSAELIGPNEYLVIGTLVLRGVPVDVAVTVEHSRRIWEPLGNERVGFKVRARVDRHDFGMAEDSILVEGGLVVGKDVEISIEAEAVRQPLPVEDAADAR